MNNFNDLVKTHKWNYYESTGSVVVCDNCKRTNLSCYMRFATLKSSNDLCLKCFDHYKSQVNTNKFMTPVSSIPSTPSNPPISPFVSSNMSFTSYKPFIPKDENSCTFMEQDSCSTGRDFFLL